MMQVLCGLCLRSDYGSMLDWVGPIRGIWRIPDGKGESGLFLCSELQGGSPCPCRLRTDHLASVSKFDYVLRQARFMRSCKPSSFYNCLIEP
jgi:hypothetical protein